MASAEARRLRRLQWAAQLEVDAVWEPLAREAEAAVLRHARVGADGVPRLDAAGAALALAEIAALAERGNAGSAAVVARAAAAARRLGERSAGG